MRSRDSFSADVLVLGGGAAGVAAAATLTRAGQSVILIEALDRLGGRIHTINDRHFPLPVELGAEFIHGRPQPTWSLARDAGSIAIHIPQNHWRKKSRTLQPADFGERLNDVFDRLPTTGRDISFGAFLEKHLRSERWRESRQVARAFVRGFEAADPDAISAHSLAREWRSMGGFEDQPQHRLLHGYSSIIRHLSRSADISLLNIKLRTRIARIRWKPGRIEAFAQTHDRSETRFRARRAIITFPLSVWNADADHPHHVQFEPELTDHRRAAAQLGFGSVVKAILVFREPFWEDPAQVKTLRARRGQSLIDATFIHAADAAFPTWWTSSPLHAPMLTAWAGGPDADALAHRSPEQLVNVAVDVLSDMLGQTKRLVRSRLLAARTCDWSKVPCIAGAYSHELVGANRAAKRLAKPIEQTFFIAGEAVSEQPATVAGALESGEDRAKELMNSK